MAGTLVDFLGSFQTDVSRVSKFDVQIGFSMNMLQNINQNLNFSSEIIRNLQFRCENAQFPSRTFSTTEQKIYGPIERFPVLTTYSEIALTFLVDDMMREKYLFDEWLNFINPIDSYDFAYRDDYAAPVTITQYNVNNQPTYGIILNNAYPVSINQLDLDWASQDYHKLAVTFTYTDITPLTIN